jgi:hypothetical protein
MHLVGRIGFVLLVGAAAWRVRADRGAVCGNRCLAPFAYLSFCLPVPRPVVNGTVALILVERGTNVLWYCCWAAVMMVCVECGSAELQPQQP